MDPIILGEEVQLEMAGGQGVSNLFAGERLTGLSI